MSGWGEGGGGDEGGRWRPATEVEESEEENDEGHQVGHH